MAAFCHETGSKALESKAGKRPLVKFFLPMATERLVLLISEVVLTIAGRYLFLVWVATAFAQRYLMFVEFTICKYHRANIKYCCLRIKYHRARIKYGRATTIARIARSKYQKANSIR